MKRIFFHSNQMSVRGTEIALYDYALYNRTLLGNESIVVYDEKNVHNNAAVIEKFRRQFSVYSYHDFAEVDRLIEKQKADLFYAIKPGGRDGVTSNLVPSMIHAIFPKFYKRFPGAAYAFISDWLAVTCSNHKVPVVPHIVKLPEINGDLRGDLGIPIDAMVFGCHGGAESFDLVFVKDCVADAVRRRRNVYFLFLNITPFIQHERVIFLPGSADMAHKVKFINSCDAMLHARKQGETFGLACAEFSLRNKPVLTFAHSGERNHIEVMGERAYLYDDPSSLMELLTGLTPTELRGRDWDCYSQHFSPEKVMCRFQKVFIDTALQRGLQEESDIVLGWVDRLVVRRHKMALRRRKRRIAEAA
jgi:hypothetical protein